MAKRPAQNGDSSPVESRNEKRHKTTWKSPPKRHPTSYYEVEGRNTEQLPITQILPCGMRTENLTFQMPEKRPI